MSIGLGARQIRKLAKRAYTDRQIARKAGNDGVYVSGKAWWTNGYIAFFEPVPENVQVRESPVTTIVEHAKVLGEMIAKCRTQVYPAEMRVYEDYRILQFENENGDSVGVDARYAASILATKRVGKAKDPKVRWHVHKNSSGDVLLAGNGRRLGLIMQFNEVNYDKPIATFRYTGELPS